MNKSEKNYMMVSSYQEAEDLKRERNKEAAARYRERNREKVNQRMRDWRDANREKSREHAREWRNRKLANGTTEEIASVALFFSSPLSSYVTGTVIPVDGGSSRFAF